MINTIHNPLISKIAVAINKLMIIPAVLTFPMFLGGSGFLVESSDLDKWLKIVSLLLMMAIPGIWIGLNIFLIFITRKIGRKAAIANIGFQALVFISALTVMFSSR